MGRKKVLQFCKDKKARSKQAADVVVDIRDKNDEKRLKQLLASVVQRDP